MPPLMRLSTPVTPAPLPGDWARLHRRRRPERHRRLQLRHASHLPGDAAAKAEALCQARRVRRQRGRVLPALRKSCVRSGAMARAAPARRCPRPRCRPRARAGPPPAPQARLGRAAGHASIWAVNPVLMAHQHHRVGRSRWMAGSRATRAHGELHQPGHHRQVVRITSHGAAAGGSGVSFSSRRVAVASAAGGSVAAAWRAAARWRCRGGVCLWGRAQAPPALGWPGGGAQAVRSLGQQHAGDSDQLGRLRQLSGRR
jgi:hypothetical protein